MSILRKKPRHEVISVRLNEDRLKLLERYQKFLTEQLGRPVSLAEAAFLVIEERVVGMDREASRHEMLSTPTDSLYHIRKKWESQHTLSAAEWDVLAQYVQIGTEEESQEPPLLRPAIPSRESYLTLLDAFEAVYQNRKKHASKHAWYYFGNLGGHSTEVRLSDNDAEQRHQAVLKQISIRKELLRPAEKWQRPGTIGRMLSHRRFVMKESRALGSIRSLPRIGRHFGVLQLGAIGYGTTASPCGQLVRTRMTFAAGLSCPIRSSWTNLKCRLRRQGARSWACISTSARRAGSAT